MLNHIMSILYSKKRHLSFSTLNTEVRNNGKLFLCSCVSPFDSLVLLSILTADAMIIKYSFIGKFMSFEKTLLLCNTNTEHQRQ